LIERDSRKEEKINELIKQNENTNIQNSQIIKQNNEQKIRIDTLIGLVQSIHGKFDRVMHSITSSQPSHPVLQSTITVNQMINFNAPIRTSKRALTNSLIDPALGSKRKQDHCLHLVGDRNDRNAN
jgi:hypothetical protein